MKKFYFLFIIGVVLIIAPAISFSGNPVKIDVLYMNHGPLQPILRELRALFPVYGDKIMVSWYDVDTDEGQRFKSKIGISRHMPLVIRVGGQSELMNNGHKIKFEGFPTGSGPSYFQGKWKLEDLANVLDQATGRN
jgi:hypothetical protein